MERETLPAEQTDQDRLLLVFAYLGPLALFALLATRREFVKWHAKQGLLVFSAVAALYVVLRPIYHLIRQAKWLEWLGELFWGAVWLVALGALMTMMLCIVRALEGERFKIPVLGDLVDKL